MVAQSCQNMLQAELEEREAAAAAKELETVRLRTMQQKATDHKSELDELRARRRARAPVSASIGAYLSSSPRVRSFACVKNFSTLASFTMSADAFYCQHERKMYRLQPAADSSSCGDPLTSRWQMEHEKKQRAEELAKAEQKATISRCLNAALRCAFERHMCLTSVRW